WFRDIERTRAALDHLLPTLRAVADPTLEDLYVAKVAARTGVRRETLEVELRKRRSRRAGSHGAGRPGRVRGPGPGTAGLPPMGAERMILHVLVHRPEWMEEVAGSLGPNDFGDASNRRVFQLLSSGDLEAASADPDPRVGARIEALRGDGEDLTHARELLESSLAVILNRSVEDRLRRLRAELGGTTNDVRRTELAREIDRLKRERMGKGANQGAAAWAVLRNLRKRTSGTDADD
ncbi:MAG TPA: hypothetical protein VE173_05220, partial [Longimicrobiales bacterium]|nr:hypothetical protein [Longimicrobiales bacterium]